MKLFLVQTAEGKGKGKGTGMKTYRERGCISYARSEIRWIHPHLGLVAEFRLLGFNLADRRLGKKATEIQRCTKHMM